MVTSRAAGCHPRMGCDPLGELLCHAGQIQQPTLIVHGNKDIVVMPINAFLLAEHLPNAQLIMYPDASHAAQSQHADVFGARSFISGPLSFPQVRARASQSKPGSWKFGV